MYFGGKIDFCSCTPLVCRPTRKKRLTMIYDYDLPNKTLDISAVSFHKMIQAAKKLDAPPTMAVFSALSYTAAQRTMFGYTDMADAKPLRADCP